MGPKLAAAWSLSAVFVSLAVGVVTVLLLPREEKPDAASDWVSKIFSISVPELAFWLVLGILAQGLLQALAPKELWQNLLLNPSAASFGDAAAAGIFRHVCIPDDVALAASLAATGFPPGWVVLLLTAGICTNLPELFVLYGMAGKKTAVLYGVVSLCAGIAAGIMTQIAIGPGFVPQYSLAGAEPMIRIANLLSIRTWLPARIPCAVLLLLLALWRIWNRRGK